MHLRRGGLFNKMARHQSHTIIYKERVFILAITFRTFISLLKEIEVTEDIYLDMGDWKYSWYRNEVGDSVDIYPSPTKFGTNWIIIPKLYDELL